MGTTNISFRIDNELKRQVENIVDDLGMNLTTVFTIFAKAIVRTGSIPIDLSIDPIYRTGNQSEIKKRLKRYEEGNAKIITKTIEELEEIVNG